MDFFNSPFFSINKRLLSIVGLWPHQDNLKKILIRSFFGLLSIISLVPHFMCLFLYAGNDPKKMIRSIANIFYILEISTKMILTIVTEGRFQRMLESIGKHWKMLKNEKELKILLKHSENGRFFTILYITYMVLTLIAFISLPMLPLIIDKIAPLNESRPKDFVLNGEYLVDPDKHYLKIYVFEGLTCIMSVFVVIGVDTTYVVCVQQCVGLMDVVKMRLSLTKGNIQQPKVFEISQKVADPISIVETVQFHQKAIDFANVVESAYAVNFLFIIVINVTMLSIGCVMILLTINRPVELFKFSIICLGLIIHIFCLSWPGQQMIDISFDILEFTYTNMWYEFSIKTKQNLLFMMMRCKDPCQLTAGGMYVMNVANCGSILKASLSYMTIFSAMVY